MLYSFLQPANSRLECVYTVHVCIWTRVQRLGRPCQWRREMDEVSPSKLGKIRLSGITAGLETESEHRLDVWSWYHYFSLWIALDPERYLF